MLLRWRFAYSVFLVGPQLEPNRLDLVSTCLWSNLLAVMRWVESLENHGHKISKKLFTILSGMEIR